MSHMTIITTNILTTTDKLVTVKRINLIIEISIFTPKGIKVHVTLPQMNQQTGP